MMLWIGLTGGLGTGKSTVGHIFRKLGYRVVDADQLAHQVLSPGEKAYHETHLNFGSEVLTEAGQINRKKLADIVFKDPEKLKLLEAIIHPEVKAKVQIEKQAAEKAGEKIAFYDVPLLFEKGLQKDFDKVVIVSCNENLQRQRLKNRNHWTNEEIDLRLKAQVPLVEKIEKSDFNIENNAGLIELEAQAQKILKTILESN